MNHITGHIKAYPAETPTDLSGRNAPSPPSEGGADATTGPQTGNTGGARPDFGKYVRCVAGNEIGANDFADNGDGTVTDAATGLMWSQADAGQDMDWEAALAYAVEMNESAYLGHTDWRVPNIRELQSIADYSGVFPAIDHEVFTWTEADRYYWSSTSGYFNTAEPEHYYAWYVAFGYAPGVDGEDIHGAGAVRFIGKAESSPAAEGDYRPLNAVRLVRDAE
ncbi:uncharacterized protein DUF1566 [Yoonia maricola]|uniref:Uncharacterized protein DUF1566 n=1 Tax=Yoonia maricola TaxID=420999 RepID=A0A2M8W049_9RHOB|nr:DUF1566 domain-containing protein [Yoonia maricola]PJI84289.1 uncharacterized protein DUF1566 [Yoonia maricola]